MQERANKLRANKSRAEELIAKGDPDQRDKMGRTLLMTACLDGDVEVVELLLKNKANPNADFFGYSVFSFVPYSSVLKENPDKKNKIENALKEAGAKRVLSLHPIALIKKMKYAQSFITNFGLCYGLASVGIDYMMRGKKGIEEMDALQFALSHDDTKELAKKIEDIQSDRQTYTRENKAKIQAKVEKKLRENSNEQDSELDQTDRNILRLYREISSEKNEKDEVIKFHLDQLIKFNTEISDNERKEIIEWIINHKFHKNILNNENVNGNEIWENIREVMLKKLIDTSVQKILDDEIRAELKVKYKDDAVLLDAPNYLQAVVISHDFSHFDRFFEDMPIDTIVNQNVFVTAPLISSIAVERQGFETSQQYGRLIGNFDRSELSIFFDKCKEYFNQEPKINNPVAFMLSTRDHAVSLAYLPDENKWAFNGYSGNCTMFSGRTDILVKNIFRNFSAGKNLKISCQIYSSKKDGDKVNGVFQKIAEDYRDKIKFTNSQNLEWWLYFSYLVMSFMTFTFGFTVLLTPTVAVIGVFYLLVASYLTNVSINGLVQGSSIEAQNEVIHAKSEPGAIKQKPNAIISLGIKLAVSIVFLTAAIFICGMVGLMGPGVVGSMGFNMATLTAGAAAFQALGSMAGGLLGLGTLSTSVAASLGTAMTVLGGTLFAAMTFFKDFRSLFKNMQVNIPPQAKTSNHSKTIGNNYTIEMYKHLNEKNLNTPKPKPEPKLSTPVAKSRANFFAIPTQTQNNDEAAQNDATFLVDTNNSKQRTIKK